MSASVGQPEGKRDGTSELVALVVDDDPTNRKLLRANFEYERMKVFEAQNGQEALDVLKERPADIVISDIGMPQMDGYQFCLAWRRQDPFHQVPIVLFSATHTSVRDEAMCLEVGADAFLKKPTPFHLLFKSVMKLLGRLR